MKRPFSVTLTVWLVLIVSSWNALKAWTSLAWQAILVEYAVQMPPMISAAAGVLWFIIGLVLAWSIWRKKIWSAKFLLVAAAVYTVWFWAERLIWQNPRPNTAFTIVVNLACLIFVFFTSKSLSREAYERNTKNPAVE